MLTGCESGVVSLQRPSPALPDSLYLPAATGPYVPWNTSSAETLSETRMIASFFNGANPG